MVRDVACVHCLEIELFYLCGKPLGCWVLTALFNLSQEMIQQVVFEDKLYSFIMLLSNLVSPSLEFTAKGALWSKSWCRQ